MNAVACPYCRVPIREPEEEALVCPGCGTPHHADCFAENGGCTVFGCVSGPPSEPKLSIGIPDLHAVDNAPATVGVAAATPPPPPPPPLVTVAPIPESPPLFSSFGYNTAAIERPARVQQQTPVRAFVEPGPDARSRTTFLILGVLLGGFGAHSFYAGYGKKGAVQLGITLLTLGFGGIMVWIWAVIDICTITTDRDGNPFRN